MSHEAIYPSDCGFAVNNGLSAFLIESLAQLVSLFSVMDGLDRLLQP